MSYRMLIIDGNYLARSRYEVGSLIGGFLAKMFDLRDKYKPAIISVCWDPDGGDPVRKKLFPEYKAKRKPRPEEFKLQVKDLRGALPWFGVVQYWGDGEADDVIATCCKTMPGPVLVYTADKDLLQVIEHGIEVCKAGVAGREDLVCNIGNCKEFTGWTPREWRDFLILRGDPVDGIPGLSKVGDKRAKNILNACPAVVDLIISGQADKARASVLAHDASQAKWIEKAIEEKDQLIVSKQLVELRVMFRLRFTEMDFSFNDACQWLDAHELGYLAERIVQ